MLRRTINQGFPGQRKIGKHCIFLVSKRCSSSFPLLQLLDQADTRFAISWRISTKLLESLLKNIFRQQCPSSVESFFCCRKTFPSTKSFVLLLSRPLEKREGACTSFVCQKKKQCSGQCCVLSALSGVKFTSLKTEFQEKWRFAHLTFVWSNVTIHAAHQVFRLNQKQSKKHNTYNDDNSAATQMTSASFCLATSQSDACQYTIHDSRATKTFLTLSQPGGGGDLQQNRASDSSSCERMRSACLHFVWTHAHCMPTFCVNACAVYAWSLYRKHGDEYTRRLRVPRIEARAALQLISAAAFLSMWCRSLVFFSFFFCSSLVDSGNL